MPIFTVCGHPHISEAAYVEKGRKRGQVCVEPHISREIPYRKSGKNAQKNTWGSPQVFLFYFVEFLQVHTIENPTRFQVFQVQSVAIDEDIRMMSAFFGQGNGTAVDVSSAIFHFTANGGVEMSVQKQVALL